MPLKPSSSKGKAEPRECIKELYQLAANEVDRAVIERQRRQWPLNLIGMSNRREAGADFEAMKRDMRIETIPERIWRPLYNELGLKVLVRAVRVTSQSSMSLRPTTSCPLVLAPWPDAVARD
jgi:hypothetical protein